MQLVEQTIISKRDPRYAAIDEVAFASKNLWNAANYLVRQSFIHEHVYLDNVKVYRQIKSHEAYKALPAKVSNQVLIQLHKAWIAFFEAMKAWREDPSRFLGRPKLPGYKDKAKGRNLLVYEQGAVSRRALKQRLLAPSRLGITLPTKQRTIKQVRIVPRIGHYVVEAVYEQAERSPTGDPTLSASLDLGVDNLGALTANRVGFVPRLINGRPIKSTNQYFNKRRAELQQRLGHPGTTARLERLTHKRNRRITHYLHAASKQIIALLVEEGIPTLIVGNNPLWKQEVELGKRNTQHFVQLPHARFLAMLRYKGHLAGVQVIEQEESYTSKASALDLDPIPTYDPQRSERPQFSGRRVHRGLYRSASGRRINADVNGSMNILRKAVPNSFGHGIEAHAVAPVRVPVLTAQPRALTETESAPTSQ